MFSSKIKMMVAVFALSPVAAFAQGFNRGHAHERDCDHDAPIVRTDSRGRYELRTVRNYVPAHYENTFVPEQCFQRQYGRHGYYHAQRCVAAHYEQRFVPGRYETSQQWVLVNGYGSNYRRASAVNTYVSPGVNVRIAAAF